MLLLLSAALAQDCTTRCDVLVVRPDCENPDLDAVEATPSVRGTCTTTCCPVYDSADTAWWLHECEDTPAALTDALRLERDDAPVAGAFAAAGDCGDEALVTFDVPLPDGDYALWGGDLLAARFTVGPPQPGCGGCGGGAPGSALAALLAAAALLRRRTSGPTNLY